MFIDNTQSISTIVGPPRQVKSFKFNETRGFCLSDHSEHAQIHMSPSCEKASSEHVRTAEALVRLAND